MKIFDKDMLLTQEEPFRFKADISDTWSIRGVPNGGYLMAVLANAMAQCSEKKLASIITANFASRCAPGEGEIPVERISHSGNFNRLGAKLIQNGEEKVRAMGTFTDLKKDAAQKKYETKAPELPPVEECINLPESPEHTFFNNVDIRLAPGCAGWMHGELSDRSELKGWIKFKDNRPMDMLATLMVADAFPPPSFATHGILAWIPTLEFSVNIRNIPETEWLKCVFRTKFINSGILEDDGEVWDEKGELIAISRQIAQFRKD